MSLKSGLRGGRDLAGLSPKIPQNWLSLVAELPGMMDCLCESGPEAEPVDHQVKRAGAWWPQACLVACIHSGDDLRGLNEVCCQVGFPARQNGFALLQVLWAFITSRPSPAANLPEDPKFLGRSLL
ncbi:hypothetical protein M407DRAFT_12320 [Tulasnella calospora MUT 4182]|uniref:Uncharacterized protein n=1 Tax=Tulasnella calospora MUT 4182 TaxID=1051891 RepID=A0A0C3Q3C6_9AGAM|nr:hypothetical protein M407DRAFT_12320 [Tulasnella calospora MUT 4182]